MSLERHLSNELLRSQKDLYRVYRRLAAVGEFLETRDKFTPKDKEVFEQILGTVNWIENFIAGLNANEFNKTDNKSEN